MSSRWNTSFILDKLNWTWSIFNRTSPHEVFIQNANHGKYSSERRGFSFLEEPKNELTRKNKQHKYQIQICLQRIHIIIPKICFFSVRKKIKFRFFHKNWEKISRCPDMVAKFKFNNIIIIFMVILAQKAASFTCNNILINCLFLLKASTTNGIKLSKFIRRHKTVTFCLFTAFNLTSFKMRTSLNLSSINCKGSKQSLSKIKHLLCW